MRNRLRRACWGALIGGGALTLAGALTMTVYLGIVGMLDAGILHALANLPAVFGSSLYYGSMFIMPPGLVTGFFLGLGWTPSVRG